jgi:hypothetical protein
MGRTRPASILAVSSYSDLGGGEILLVDLLTALAARGFAVELAALGDGAVAARARDREIPVTVCPPVRLSRAHTVAGGVRALRPA